MWEYSEKVNDLFLHPENVGEIESPYGREAVNLK